MTAAPSPPSASHAPAGGPAVTAVRLAAVPLVEVRLTLPVPVPDPRSAAVTEVAAELLFGPGTPVTRSLARLGCYVVAAADQDALCVAATGPAAALPDLLAGIAGVLARPPAGAVVDATIRSLAEQVRAAGDDPETVATRTVLAAAYGVDSPYAHELPSSRVIASVRPEEVRELCGRITTAGGSVVVVGDVDPSRTVEAVVHQLDGLGGPPVAAAALPVVPAAPGVNIAVHRPGARQSMLRRVLVLPPGARDEPAWRVCDLLFGGQPSSRLAHRLREENGYAYIARSRLVRRPRRADLRVTADVGTDVTGAALTALDEVTRRLADGVGDDERGAAGTFAANSLLMSWGGQSDLAGVLTQELGLGRGTDDVAADAAALTAVPHEEVGRAARELARGAWHTVLVGDLDVIGPGTLPVLGGVGWRVTGGS